MRRFFPHPTLSFILVAIWLLLVNELSVGALLVGTAVGVLTPLLTSRFWPTPPSVRLGFGMVAYLLVVLWDIVVANFQVAYLILFRANRDLRPRWLVVPLDLRSPEAITALAATISLTPGTVSSDVAADGRSLLVHAIDAPDEAAAVARIKSRYEARLTRIFR